MIRELRTSGVIPLVRLLCCAGLYFLGKNPAHRRRLHTFFGIIHIPKIFRIQDRYRAKMYNTRAALITMSRFAQLISIDARGAVQLF